MTRARGTVLFVVLTLVLSWAVGWLWVTHPGHGWLTQVLMCVPAVVGLSVSGLSRGEPPRAVGLGVGLRGAWPWVAAFLYPFVLAAASVALAYAVRAVTGDAAFIRYQPEAVQTGGWFGVPRAPGLVHVGARVLVNLWRMSPWLLLAIAYHLALPERLLRALPPSLRFVHHGLRAGLWALVLWAYPGTLGLPGAIGEELGWRGTLVRWWADRPLVAFAITAPVWAAFHLPVVLAPTQAGHLLQNVVFLGSIAAAAVPFAALYVVCRSVWPCVVLHFTWNFWNPFLLGDVYGGGAGVFGGAVWAFNGEGLFGLIWNGALAAWLCGYFRRRAHAGPAVPAAVPGAGAWGTFPGDRGSESVLAGAES